MRRATVRQLSGDLITSAVTGLSRGGRRCHKTTPPSSMQRRGAQPVVCWNPAEPALNVGRAQCSRPSTPMSAAHMRVAARTRACRCKREVPSTKREEHHATAQRAAVARRRGAELDAAADALHAALDILACLRDCADGCRLPARVHHLRCGHTRRRWPCHMCH